VLHGGRLNVKGKDLDDPEHLWHVRCVRSHINNIFDPFLNLVSDIKIFDLDSGLH